MHRDQTNVLNPNTVIDYALFEGNPFFGSPDNPFPTEYIQPSTVAQHQQVRRQVLDRILDNASGSDLPGIDHFTEYLYEKYRRNCRPNTLRLTATSLIQFLSFYRKLGKNQLDQIGREDIEAFVEHEQDRGLKPNSVRTRLCVVYAFLRFLINKKVLGYELLERRIRLRLADNLPRAIEPEHVKHLLSVIDHIRDRAMILLLLRTGMRIGELLNTKVDDVDLRDKKILIYEADKTGVGRVVYFSEDALQALIDWLQIRNLLKQQLFYAQGRTSLSYESARSMFKKYLQKANLQYHGYTLHCLRHTFATDLLNARMPLECLRVLLGHTNLEVTRRYARLTDKTREEEYFNAMNKVIRDDFDEYDQCDN